MNASSIISRCSAQEHKAAERIFIILNSIKNTDDAIVTDILRIFKQAIEDVCIAQLEEEQAIIICQFVSELTAAPVR